MYVGSTRVVPARNDRCEFNKTVLICLLRSSQEALLVHRFDMLAAGPRKQQSAERVLSNLVLDAQDKFETLELTQ